MRRFTLRTILSLVVLVGTSGVARGEKGSEAAPPTLNVIEYHSTFTLVDPGGTSYLVEATRKVFGTPDNVETKATFNGPTGLFVLRSRVSGHPPHSHEITASIEGEGGHGPKIEYASGPETQYVESLGGETRWAFKHQLIRCGAQVLEFSELDLEQLLAGKASEKGLAALREAVPDVLRDFAELYVSVADLMEPSPSPTVLMLARVAAPKGTKSDSARHGWHKEDAKFWKTETPIPLRTSPPDLSDGGQTSKLKLEQ